MTYKQLETSREVRLWATSIIIPTVVLLATQPEIRQCAVDKMGKFKNFIKNKFKKKETES